MAEETKLAPRSGLRIVALAMGLAVLIISVLMMIIIGKEWFFGPRMLPVGIGRILKYGSPAHMFLAVIALVLGVISVIWKASPKAVPISGTALSIFLILASILWWFGVIGPYFGFSRHWNW
jgi:hypothetical protein